MSLIFQAHSGVIAPKLNVWSFEINYFHLASTIFTWPQLFSLGPNYFHLAPTIFIALSMFSTIFTWLQLFSLHCPCSQLFLLGPNYFHCASHILLLDQIFCCKCIKDPAEAYCLRCFLTAFTSNPHIWKGGWANFNYPNSWLLQLLSILLIGDSGC